MMQLIYARHEVTFVVLYSLCIRETLSVAYLHIDKGGPLGLAELGRLRLAHGQRWVQGGVAPPVKGIRGTTPEKTVRRSLLLLTSHVPL